MLKECCNTCKYKKSIYKLDFKDKPVDTDLEGYCCIAFASQGDVAWMMNRDPATGHCECYRLKIN